MTPINAIEDYLPMSTRGIAVASDGGIWLYHPPSPGGMIELEAPTTPTPPVNTVPPSINVLTDLVVGSQAVMINGTWANSPTFTRTWTSGGTTIPGATATSYTFQTSDIGNMIGGDLTGTNQDGSVTVPTSNTVGPIVAPAADEPPADDPEPTMSVRQAAQRPQTRHSSKTHKKRR
jgi:hypothetical protein